MNTPLKKALRDLSANKSRTMLAIAAIFFGVFGTGLILDLYSVAGREMDVSFAATNPSSFSIRVNEYNDDLLASLSKASGVEEVEARRKELMAVLFIMQLIFDYSGLIVRPRRV